MLLLILILLFVIILNFEEIEYFTQFIPTITTKPNTYIVTRQIGSTGFLVSSEQPINDISSSQIASRNDSDSI